MGTKTKVLIHTDISGLTVKGSHGITNKNTFQNYLLLFFSNVSAYLDKLYFIETSVDMCK